MQQSDNPVTITLDPNGTPVPDRDPVRVKMNAERVRFEAAFPFTVDIQDYSDVQYGSGGGKHHCRTGVFTKERKHKYSITANGKTNDPDLDIKP
jgi:hypothetical protein